MTIAVPRECHSLAELPTVAEIVSLVDDHHYFVLSVVPGDEPNFDERFIIERLTHEMPDFAVFNNGGAVTIKKVVSEANVLANADAIVAAAAQFESTATDLMGRLRGRFGIPAKAFFDMTDP